MPSNSIHLNELFKAAMSHHQSGNFQDAERCYRGILQISPRHFDALHFLGVLRAQCGSAQEGIKLIQQALSINPRSAEANSNLGNVLLEAGRPEEAAKYARKALGIHPGNVMAMYIQGNALRDLQQLEEALRSFDAALAIDPRFFPALNSRGTLLKDLGRFHDALASFERALALVPGESRVLVNVGNIQRALGREDEALASYRKAIALQPDFAGAHYELGNALRGQSRLTEAVASLRMAVSLRPDFALAHNNLGDALHDLDQLDEAIGCYRKALALMPDFADAHNNLGIALYDQGRFDDAVSSHLRALAIKTDFAEAHNNLGNALKEQGKLDEAIASYHRALSFKPMYAEAHSNLGLALKEQNKLDDAIAHYHKALAIRPDYAAAHSNLGIALHDRGNFAEAIACHHKALSLKPDHADAYNNLGMVLNDQGRLDDALASYRKAIAIKPDLANAYNNLGVTLQNLGKFDDAVASYRKALSLKPDYAELHGNLLFLSAYQFLLDPPAYLALARGWEFACVPEQDRTAARNRVFQRAPLAGRRLKVGYVSGDYRRHAVGFFIEQLFIHHDRTRIELFAYSTHRQRDESTVRFESLAEHWAPVFDLSDAATLERIAADGIDVLVDLSGYTRNNRLGVFARRAAPVQADYLGYFASTGLTEMDYWIGDDIVTPAATDSHFSEQVWRLPRTWLSYDGKADAPLPLWRPAADGTVWLGSFNQLNKLTPATLALWAKVLHALPEGRLLLKTALLVDVSNRQRILDALTAHGIAAHRVELQDGSATPTWGAHMGYYDRLDIALDPVGAVGGGTTTCDALWMGVPVVTLAGDRMASRMTASMLDALGHPEWITQAEAEYIDTVVALARDVDSRTSLRGAQRSRMAQSPLCDSRDLAVNLENAYFDMFARWREGKNERNRTS